LTPGAIVFVRFPEVARLLQIIDMRFTLLLTLLVVLDPAAHGSETLIAVGQSIFKGESNVTSGQAWLFNATSCDSCHPSGAGGIGPITDGPLPVGLVVQLGSPSGANGTEGDGDPVYGRIFNTAAAVGVQAEGVATVRYSEIEGHYYPEAVRWRMRVPHYQLTKLSRGPLAAATVIKPRLAPALFGAALLEAVPESAITHIGTGANVSPGVGEPSWHLHRGMRVIGRFGWQAASVSIRDQTAKAFAREMGLTSPDQPYDDCTPAEADCLRTRNGASPSISADSISAVLAYVGAFAVPESPMRSEQFSSGLRLFIDLGCAACHRPELPVDFKEKGSGTQTPSVIAPYTDLLLHDLGIELGDETATGTRVPTKWRTAPLWGLGYRIRYQHSATLLHDGRARSVEEAILWHSGEAARSQHGFLNLLRRRREELLRWLESL
jgi:CxxC motif-containing protein (DUF1111 family)